MKHISMNNRILMLVSTGFLLFMGICFSVSDSYARYDNEIVETVIYKDVQQKEDWSFLEQCTLKTPYTKSLDEISQESTDNQNLDQESISSDTEPINPLMSEDADTFMEPQTDADSKEPVADTGKEDSTEEKTESPTEGDGVTEQGAFQIIDHYREDEMVLMQLQFPLNCDKAVVSLNGTEMFLKGLRYSLDGKAGYELNHNGYIEVDRSKDGNVLLLIQMPEENTDIIWNSLRATFFEKEAIHSYIDETLMGTDSIPCDVILQEETEILKEKGVLNWKMPKLFEGFTAEVKLEYLTEQGYADIPRKDSLKIEQTDLEEEGVVNVKISNGEESNALAGAYRAVFIINYSFENSKIQLQKMAVPFFVNYRE